MLMKFRKYLPQMSQHIPLNVCCGGKTIGKPWRIKFPPMATEADIYYAFRLILGRNPSEQEWTGHKLQAGQSLNSIIGAYVNSLEFKQRRMYGSSEQQYALVDLDTHKLYVYPGDTAVGSHIYRSGIYEPHVTEILKQVLSPGMVFVDIGANIGYFSMLAAHIVGDSGKIYAFEPAENNIKLMYHSIQVNQFQNVTIYPFAVSSRTGLVLYGSEASNGRIADIDDIELSMSSIMVFGIKLDEISLIDHIDVLKIDVEGAEYLALSGAYTLLKKSRPIIFSEFSPPALLATSGVDAGRYLDLLRLDEDYRFSVISEQGDLVECGTDANAVIDIFENTHTDHIDIVVFPMERKW